MESNGGAISTISSLTAKDNFFEDFEVGAVYEHARGKTVGEIDNVLITNLVMNTAQGHFNEHQMAATEIGHRLTFGGVTASLVIGLAMEDTGENAVAELALDKIRFRTPVLHGDTLYAFSEVLDKGEFDARAAGRPDLAHWRDVGEVRFRHWGLNQRGETVFEGERRVLIKHRSFKVPATAGGKAARPVAARKPAPKAAPAPRPAKVAARARAAKKTTARKRRR